MAKQFKKFLLAPKGTQGYFQPFTARVRRVVVPDSLRETRNVLGFLDNSAEYTIVIGAHFDHLGLGNQGSSKTEKPEGQIHNGADDNASGVAGLLELARYFSENDKKEPYNFLFIAFGAEELGLQGSRYFINNPALPLDCIDFMTNMDMIGRYNPDRGVGIGGYGTSAAWPGIFGGVASEIKFFTDRAGSRRLRPRFFLRQGDSRPVFPHRWPRRLPQTHRRCRQSRHESRGEDSQDRNRPDRERDEVAEAGISGGEVTRISLKHRS